MSIDSATSNTAARLRARVEGDGGLLAIPKAELRDLVRMKRFRSSPENKGSGSAKLARLLQDADLGALPIGQESETLSGRTAQGFSEGVFGEILSMKDTDLVALFDKQSNLGRVLLLAGNPGSDYQALALGLQADFTVGNATSLVDIRIAADGNGGFAVVRQGDLVGDQACFDEAALKQDLDAVGLLPLPVCAGELRGKGPEPDCRTLFGMSADDLVGVASIGSSESGLTLLLRAVALTGKKQAVAAGALAWTAISMFGPRSPWLSSTVLRSDQ